MKKDVLVGLTMKSLDYFKNGIPIINNINGDTWEFVENYGVGINTTDGFISSLVIQNYLENFAKIQDFYQNKFSEDTFNVELSKILKEILDY